MTVGLLRLLVDTFLFPADLRAIRPPPQECKKKTEIDPGDLTLPGPDLEVRILAPVILFLRHLASRVG